MKKKNPTSMRLSSEALRMIAQLSDQLAVNQTAVLELAIRQMWERETKRPNKYKE